MTFSDVIMFVGITAICGAPLWMALFILHEMMFDNWGKTCRHCNTTVYDNGCRCGRTKARG